MNKGFSGILGDVTVVVWESYFLVFEIIFRIRDEVTISVSVLNPNTSCNRSVRSVRVYSGRYPYPLIFNNLYSRSVSMILEAVYVLPNFFSRIRNNSNAI